MVAVIQEYVNLLYEKYDSLDIIVPTGLGITNYIKHTLIENLSKKKQNVLFLLPNKSTSTQEYISFCKLFDKHPTNTIGGYCEFPNGSTIHILPFNQVQKVIYKYCDVIILSGLYFNLDSLNVEFLDKVKSINKQIVVNCEMGKGKYVLFNENTHLAKIDRMDKLDEIKNIVRSNKLEKIRKSHERRDDRSVSMVR